MSEVKEKLDTVLNRLDELEEKIEDGKGGKQPKAENQIRVKKENGSPGSEEVRDILRKAKEGSKTNGVDSSQVKSILREHGKERRRPTDLMQRISDAFPKYRYVIVQGRAQLQFRPEMA